MTNINWFQPCLKSDWLRLVNSPVRDIGQLKVTGSTPMACTSFGQIFRGCKTLTQRRLRTGARQISGLTLIPLHNLGFCYQSIQDVMSWFNIVNQFVWVLHWKIKLFRKICSITYRTKKPTYNRYYGARNNILIAPWMRLLRFNHGDVGLTGLFLIFACLSKEIPNLCVRRYFSAYSKTWIRLNPLLISRIKFEYHLRPIKKNGKQIFVLKTVIEHEFTIC